MLPLNLLFTIFLLKYVSCQIPEHELLPCESDYECEELRGQCIRHFCRCNGTSFCSESDLNIQVTRIGGYCRKNHDCNIGNAYCLKNKCICKSDYVPSTNRRRCLTVAERLGGECQDNVQCSAKIPLSSCHENKCACRQKTQEHNGFCYKIIELNSPCQHNEECFKVEKAMCVKNQCKCVDGFVGFNSRCYEIADGLESPCMEDIQCTENLGSWSLCKNGFCQCQELFQVKNATGKCVHDLLLDEVCMNNTDCHQPNRGLSRLECILGACKCRPTYFQQDGHCISFARRNLSSLVSLSILFILYLF